ncbi:kinase-like protein [Dacryopinax primogenitus]|uniref:Kinase-like protein n=1 Tax=Dacryopinax primogenitus (strain DJM 731) TaxID=1858805 RepID=M5G125_DACPD|nr:kinase-like protein [Dacryopinax primogenitus]EJU01860.1 kinase-like protein [Dacryopinax primogenitus]
MEKQGTYETSILHVNDDLNITCAYPPDLRVAGVLKLFESISVSVIECTRIGNFPIDGGGYADVWRGKRSSDGMEVALKGLRINHEDQVLIKLLIREISIWSTLDHPNVLPFLGLSIQPGWRIPCLVSPWLTHGNVMKYLELHDDADRAELIDGVADGLKYLHEKGVVHGDVKGANILVASDGHPVLADFGLSVMEEQNSQGQTTTQTFAGSMRWMAPERLAPDQFGMGARTSRTFASDIYSFGMTIYEIYSGNLPFHELGNMEASIAVVNGRRPVHPGDVAIQRGLTPNLWIFITRCWEQKPDARPELSELAQDLDGSVDTAEITHALAATSVAATPPPAYSAFPGTSPPEHTFEVYRCVHGHVHISSCLMSCRPCPFCDPDNEFGYVCEHRIPWLEDAHETSRKEYAIGNIPIGHSECVTCSRLAPIRKGVKRDRCAYLCEVTRHPP